MLWVFRQHNKMELLCCGRTHNTTPTTVTQKCQRPENPQHNNLKLLLWVFWTLALVGHRSGVYGHDTIAILWVQHDITRWVKWRRYSIKTESFSLRNAHMTCHQSVFKRYHSDKHFSEFLPERRRQKSTGRDKKHKCHCRPMYNKSTTNRTNGVWA